MKTKILLATVACLGLSACNETFSDPFHGHLTLSRDLTLKTTDKKNPVIVLPARSHYSANVQISAKKIFFSWSVNGDESAKGSTELVVPKPLREKLKYVTQIESINATAAELEQSFGVKGIDTKNSKDIGAEVSEKEYCKEDTGMSHQECHTVYIAESCTTDLFGDETCTPGHNTEECNTIIDYYIGKKNVRYFPVQLSGVKGLAFVDVGGAEIGRLEQPWEQKSKRYTYQGTCE